MSSISSSSSSTSSTMDTPFRSIYAKDARGQSLSTSRYYRKYGSSQSDSAFPSISRLIYAKDARGVQLSPSSYKAESYECIKTTPIVGDDGLPRGPYDHGQRQRKLSYWSEVRSMAGSIASSSASFMSARSK